jgi:hypothetical protein
MTHLVSLKVIRSAIKHLDQPQGTKVNHETPGSAINYIDQPRNTWVSVKVLGTVMEHLG